MEGTHEDNVEGTHEDNVDRDGAVGGPRDNHVDRHSRVRTTGTR